MDKITKKMIGVLSSMDNTILVNERHYNNYENTLKQGERTWYFADQYRNLDEAKIVAFKGVYASASEKAKEWAKSQGLNEVFHISSAEFTKPYNIIKEENIKSSNITENKEDSLFVRTDKVEKFLTESK